MTHALIVEGGGMKAAYAHGVLTAFERAGHLPWDVTYGSSAGGALVAWHAAGQADYGEGIWRYVADRRFLSYRRALRGGPLLDHDALIELVYRSEHPIDVARVRKARHEVRVVVADADSAETRYPDIRHGDTLAWVKATGRLPLGSNGPVEVEGRRYLDGGCTDPIPVRHAIDEGADTIDVILNQPMGTAQRDNPFFLRLASRRYPALAPSLAAHVAHKADAWKTIQGPPKGVKVRLIAPGAPTGLHRMSREPSAIRRALALGRVDGRRHLAR